MSNKDKLRVVADWVGATAQVLAVVIIFITAYWVISFISKGA